MTLSVIVFDCMIIEERKVYRMKTDEIISNFLSNVMMVLVLIGVIPFLLSVVLIGLARVLIW